MEQESIPGATQKIQEYITRIQSGESKESVMQGLPLSFVSAIEAGLNTKEENLDSVDKSNKTESDITVPAQYAGLDSETLDFIWTIPEYLDPEKTKREKERKAIIVENLREKENRLQNEQKKIDELRSELGAVDNKEGRVNTADLKTKELMSRIEQNKVILPNIETLVKNEGGNLEVIVNGQKIDFDKFIVLVEPETESSRHAIVSFIEKKNKTENPGIGLPVYLQLGKNLAEKGITLVSSDAQYAQGQSIWMNLAKLGYAKKNGRQFEFVGPAKNHEGENVPDGTEVLYLGQKHRVIESIDHTYESGRKVKMYHLENEVGTPIQTGNVRKYVTRDEFEPFQ